GKANSPVAIISTRTGSPFLWLLLHSEMVVPSLVSSTLNHVAHDNAKLCRTDRSTAIVKHHISEAVVVDRTMRVPEADMLDARLRPLPDVVHVGENASRHAALGI